VRRQLRTVVAETAEEHDLAEPGSTGGASDVLGGSPVDCLEALRAERVNEVHGDIHPVQDGERRLVGRVGDEPAHVPVVLARTARERDDLVRFCEPRQERRPDHARRTEHRDPHRGLTAVRVRKRRLIAR
jgi:hypothetical protein